MIALLATLVIVSPNPAHVKWISHANVRLPQISRLTIKKEPCPALANASCVVTNSPSTIYLLPSDDNKYTLLHELGHVYDRTTMPSWQRRAFRRIMKYKQPWESGWRNNLLVSPGVVELFADAYMSCATSSVLTGGYGWWPTRRQYRRVCHMLRRR